MGRKGPSAEHRHITPSMEYYYQLSSIKRFLVNSTCWTPLITGRGSLGASVVVVVVRRVVVELKQPFVFDYILVMVQGIYMYIVVGNIRLTKEKTKIIIMMSMGTLCIQEYSFLQFQCCLPTQNLV